FVADLRAPTPSAAAELVAKNAADVLERIQGLKARLWQCYKHHMKTYADRVNFLAKRLVHPERRLQDLSLRCDELSLRLDAAMKRYLEAQRKHLALARQRLGTPYEL